MKHLFELLEGTQVRKLHGDGGVEIGTLVYDSRAVEPGACFFAVPGTQCDGHDFIPAAVEKGAAAVVCSRLPATLAEGVAYAEVDDPAGAMADMAAAFYDHPSCELKLVGITGTNGKTTTTSLIYKIMRDAGLNVALGGNIGESFAYSVATGDYDWYVLELSSFQLDGMYRFRAHIGVLMNITPDHLDRYDHCFRNYVDSKMRITQNQTSRDWFVYSGDDETIRQQLPKYDLRMRQLPFAARNAVASGAGDAFLCDGKFTAAAGKESVEIDMSKIRIAGLHNAYNAMAAALATLAAGVAPAKIRKSLYDFAPVEHRLEPVAEKQGVLWINDSKATNVDSVWYALESMKRPLVWIAGGTDKGNDYGPLKEFARQKVHTLVCMGLDNAKLVGEFSGVVPDVVSVDSFEAAMTAAKAAARPGDAVLLSPACASFDLFKNYEHRGEMFKNWVNQH